MKFIIILMLLMAAHCHASWFHNDDQQRSALYEQQLAAERYAKGGWEIFAGVFAVGGVILFTVGTALGSRIRRDAEKEAHRD